MGRVTFYHNARVDRATRTGLTVNGRRGLEHYEPGDEESDPRLLWSVDVHSFPDVFPVTIEELERWFAERTENYREALAYAAGQLAVGMDFTMEPWTFEWSGPSGPLRVTVAAMRTESSRAIGQVLGELANGGWAATLASLQPYEVPTTL